MHCTAPLKPRTSKMQPQLEMPLNSDVLPFAITLKVWWSFIFLSIHDWWSKSCTETDKVFVRCHENTSERYYWLPHSIKCKVFEGSLQHVWCMSVWYTDTASCSFHRKAPCLFPASNILVWSRLSLSWKLPGLFPTTIYVSYQSILEQGTIQPPPHEFNSHNCRLFPSVAHLNNMENVISQDTNMSIFVPLSSIKIIINSICCINIRKYCYASAPANTD